MRNRFFETYCWGQSLVAGGQRGSDPPASGEEARLYRYNKQRAFHRRNLTGSALNVHSVSTSWETLTACQLFCLWARPLPIAVFTRNWGFPFPSL